jgi:hypothetical protein
MLAFSVSVVGAVSAPSTCSARLRAVSAHQRVPRRLLDTLLPRKWGSSSLQLTLYLSLRYGLGGDLGGASAGQEVRGRLLLGCRLISRVPGRFLGVCEHASGPPEHMFVYRLLVLRWAHLGAPGVAYVLQGPRAVTCRPFYGVMRRHLGLSRAPHSIFPV